MTSEDATSRKTLEVGHLSGVSQITIGTDDVIRQRLNDVDWSFSARKTRSGIDALHPYPAKFIPEIPRALLQILPRPEGTEVLDPFCGSGTTLAECQAAGIDAIGVDLNPIACLISQVRTSDIPDTFETASANVLRLARKNLTAEIPDIPRLDHWFEEDVQRALAALKAAITTYEPGPIRSVLDLVFSSIIVRVSNQESDTRYAAIEKQASFEGTFSAFERSSQKIAKALSSVRRNTATTKIIERDILSVSNEDIGTNIGMVITSPPYPNAYEYWLYHKYRMWWLQKDPLAVKAQEIGARAHFFKKNHHTSEDFGRQMGGTLDLIRSGLGEGCFACFVVGRSKIHGKYYDNAEIIKDEGEKRGFRPFWETQRPILSTSKSFNLSHANIKTETILVLQKERRFGTELA